MDGHVSASSSSVQQSQQDGVVLPAGRRRVAWMRLRPMDFHAHEAGDGALPALDSCSIGGRAGDKCSSAARGLAPSPRSSSRFFPLSEVGMFLFYMISLSSTPAGGRAEPRTALRVNTTSLPRPDFQSDRVGCCRLAALCAVQIHTTRCMYLLSQIVLYLGVNKLQAAQSPYGRTVT